MKKVKGAKDKTDKKKARVKLHDRMQHVTDRMKTNKGLRDHVEAGVGASARTRRAAAADPAPPAPARRGKHTLPEDTVDVQPEHPTDLGPIELPNGPEAVKALGILAELNDRCLRAHEAFLEQAEKTKKAKKRWDDLQVELQQKIRLATHASALPLFEAADREHDQQQLNDAIKAGGQARGANGADPSTQPGQPLASAVAEAATH